MATQLAIPKISTQTSLMHQKRTLKKMILCLRSQEWIRTPPTNTKIRNPRTNFKTNRKSTTEPKKLATRLKMHFRGMMIYSPRLKNMYSY